MDKQEKELNSAQSLAFGSVQATALRWASRLRKSRPVARAGEGWKGGA